MDLQAPGDDIGSAERRLLIGAWSGGCRGRSIVDVSQMQVSRLLARSLATLRAKAEGEESLSA